MNNKWISEIKNINTPKIYAQFGEESIFDHILKNIQLVGDMRLIIESVCPE